MKSVNRIKRTALFSMVVFAAATSIQAAPAKESATTLDVGKAVREKLENLPYYGVFDVLNYQMGENNTVTLGGFVFRDSLKKEAEDAVLKVPGVKGVINQIEDLQWGVSDDDIRAGVYLAIYRNSFLSRYGTITDQALANGVGFGARGRYGVFGAPGIGNPYFPGFNPAGDYGIRILVSYGDVILMGEVNSEGDKILAEHKARGVFPVKKVYNELTVRGDKPEVPQPVPAPLVKKKSIIADGEAF